jgi:CRP/FNR family transcriptional regulator, cyclic AMP receptor protein
MKIDTAWLEENVFGHKLSADETDALNSLMEADSVAKGGKIVTHGQAGGTLYLLRTGSVLVQTDGDSPVDVATLHAGAVIGEMSFLTDDAASANVIAVSDCNVIHINRSGFSELMNRHEELAFSLFVYILRHTATVIRHMNEEHVSMMQYIVGTRMGT